MGKGDVAGIADPQSKDLAEQGIHVRHGIKAEKINSAGNRVIFANGAEEAYDVLLVATGGKPEIPPALRKEHPAILPFDSLEDTLRIAERIPRSGTVAVYGPGFLAIVASSALRKRGNDVVWFQPDLPRPGYPISGELEANIHDSVRNTGCESSTGRTLPLCGKLGGESRSNPPKKERGFAASPSWWPPNVSRRSAFFPAAE